MPPTLVQVSTLNIITLKGLKLKGMSMSMRVLNERLLNIRTNIRMTFEVSYNQSVSLHFSIYPLTAATTEGNHLHMHSTPRLCHQFRVQDLPQGHRLQGLEIVLPPS